MSDLRQHLRCLAGLHEWVHFAMEFGAEYEFCTACGYRENDEEDE